MRSQKPKTVTQKLLNREMAWTVALTLETFTAKQLAAECHRSMQYTHALVGEWVINGYVTDTTPEVRMRKVYRLTPKAQELKRAKETEKTRVQNPLGNMWLAMRHLPSFTFRDICMHATTDKISVSETEAREYCMALSKAGYLRVEAKANGKSLARYRLIRNTGPTPPELCRVQAVFDRNRNSIKVIDRRVA